MLTLRLHVSLVFSEKLKAQVVQISDTLLMTKAVLAKEQQVRCTSGLNRLNDGFITYMNSNSALDAAVAVLYCCLCLSVSDRANDFHAFFVLAPEDHGGEPPHSTQGPCG